jgi:hypothetical protein
VGWQRTRPLAEVVCMWLAVAGLYMCVLKKNSIDSKLLCSYDHVIIGGMFLQNCVPEIDINKSWKHFSFAHTESVTVTSEAIGKSSANPEWYSCPLKKDISEINFPSSICAGHDFNKFSSHRSFEVHDLACLLGQCIPGRFTRIFEVTVAGLIVILGALWFVPVTTLLNSLSRQRKVIRNAFWFRPLQLANERPALRIVVFGLRYGILLPNQNLRKRGFRRISKIAKSWYLVRHVRPSVYPHETTRLTLDGFSWNLIFF